jgi:hypothetical protein
MTEIYRGCAFNIAASAAGEGFLNDFSIPRPPTFTPQWGTKENIKLHLTRQSSFDRDVTRAPLNLRGWVLQERLLSPRILHFARYQIYWECSRTIASEEYQHHLPSHLYSPRARRMRGYWERIPADSGDRENLYVKFYNVIREYSDCALTNPQDKLVAVSGIARLMQKTLKDDYVAGYWLKTLPRALLWSVSTRPQVSSAIQYRAPSWSWASTDGELDFPAQPTSQTIESRSSCTLRDYSIDLKTSDPFGQIAGGWIRLSGLLKTITISARYDGAGTAVFSIANEKSETGFMQPTLSTPASRLHFLLIDEHAARKMGLLLQPTGKAKGQFRRWAMLKFYTEKSFEAFDSSNHDWLEYESIEEDGGYVVTII